MSNKYSPVVALPGVILGAVFVGIVTMFALFSRQIPQVEFYSRLGIGAGFVVGVFHCVSTFRGRAPWWAPVPVTVLTIVCVWRIAVVTATYPLNPLNWTVLVTPLNGG